MYNFLFAMALILSGFSCSVSAEILNREQLPEKIIDHIYKKHPGAQNIAAVPEKHFGQNLYKITFQEKVGEETKNQTKYYRVNGNFYVDGVKIETSANASLLPTASDENLKAAFSGYKIDNALMIVNPNGIGEEYDLIVDSNGSKWRVIMDNEGKVALKEPL